MSGHKVAVRRKLVAEYLAEQNALDADRVEVTLVGGFANGETVECRRQAADIEHVYHLPTDDDEEVELAEREAIDRPALLLLYRRADQDAVTAEFVQVVE